MRSVLALILGGGQGTRLFPLTELRSKPAVPIGGKYRLIDVPISNCLHADLRRIYVLTQFNSESLNRHVNSTYRMDPFTTGFVEILAAEQTPDSKSWFEGTADAVRKARRHFEAKHADYYLILAGDHLYRMNYRALLDAHLERGADITIAAQPCTAHDATSMGIFTFDRSGQITRFEEKPNAARLADMKTSLPDGVEHGSGGFSEATADKPFVASMGIYLFSRRVLLDMLEQDGNDFGRQLIPAALSRYRVSAYLYSGYWADVGTIDSFYDANIQLTHPDASFSFYDATCPIYTHQRFLPPSRLIDCRIHNGLVAEGCYLDRCEIADSVVGIRSIVRTGAQVRRSVLLGADYYEDGRGSKPVDIGIGANALVEQAIIDKNARIGDGARLVNTRKIDELDGGGFYIRNGIIIVPKGGVIPAGFTV
ncbi:MAG TPA: glucose-1-phosphate adenylyltransferase [Vicinamibacterales bacterium]|nr:glucose-1-phosphate adenylyltransferase [Vicinamibacterales bacterium]